MPNVGWGEIMIVLVVALIVFGPNRLPEMARNVGKFVRNFQRETSNALAELKEGIEPVKVGVFDEPDTPSPGASSAPLSPVALADGPAAAMPAGVAATARRSARASAPAPKAARARKPAPSRKPARARKPVPARTSTAGTKTSSTKRRTGSTRSAAPARRTSRRK